MIWYGVLWDIYFFLTVIMDTFFFNILYMHFFFTVNLIIK